MSLQSWVGQRDILRMRKRCGSTKSYTGKRQPSGNKNTVEHNIQISQSYIECAKLNSFLADLYVWNLYDVRTKQSLFRWVAFLVNFIVSPFKYILSRI